MAKTKKKTVSLKPRKSGGSPAKCVFGVYEYFVGPGELVGLFQTRQKATRAVRSKQRENPKYDYSISRLCVK